MPIGFPEGTTRSLHKVSYLAEFTLAGIDSSSLLRNGSSLIRDGETLAGDGFSLGSDGFRLHCHSIVQVAIIVSWSAMINSCLATVSFNPTIVATCSAIVASKLDMVALGRQ